MTSYLKKHYQQQFSKKNDGSIVVSYTPQKPK